MSLLAPFFLLGALAIAGPVWFHLQRRATRDRTEFSALLFLRPGVPLRQRRSRLKNWWLLLLRCLALALVAAGFARPFFRPAALPLAVPLPKRLVVLLDVSASLRRTGLWPAALAEVRQVVAAEDPREEVSVLAFGRSSRPVVTAAEWNSTPPGQRRDLVAGRLPQLAPTWEGTNLGGALAAAAEALADTGPQPAAGPREIVVVSDLQSGADLHALQGYEWPKGVAVRLRVIGGRGRGNAGLQLLEGAAGGDPAAGGETAAGLGVRLRVTNSPEAGREQFRLGWADASGAPVGPAREVYVPAGGTRIVTLPVAGAEGAQRVRLRGDEEEFDNTLSVLPPRVRAVTVTYLGEDQPDDPRGPRYFLARALHDTDRETIRVQSAGPGAPLPRGDFYIVTTAPSPAAFAALQAEVAAGRNALAVPRTAADLQQLAVALGAAGAEVGEVRPPNYAMLAEIDFQHPLFSVFADPRFSDFTKIHFWSYRRLAPGAIPGSRVLARFDAGDPALLEVPRGAGHWWILASGWTPADSQLALSSKFVPLLSAMLDAGAGAAPGASAYVVGDPVPWPAGAAVTRPDGTTEPPAAGATVYQNTDTPGIYTFATAGGAVPFAVNLDPAESRTGPLAADDLAKLGVPLAGAAGARPAAVAAAPAVDGATEGAQQLWRWCLLAALGVLLVESALGGWLARRRPGAEVAA